MKFRFNFFDCKTGAHVQSTQFNIDIEMTDSTTATRPKDTANVGVRDYASNFRTHCTFEIYFYVGSSTTLVHFLPFLKIR